MIRDFFLFSWRNMKHRKLRAWLTIIGVIIGIAAIVSLITIGEGLETAIVDQFGVLGADKIRVAPAGLTGPPVGISGLTEDDVDTVRDTIGVDYAGGLLFSSAVFGFDQEETVVFVKGLDASLAEENKIDVNVEIAEGAWFRSGERGVAIIGHSLAENVFSKEIRERNTVTLDGEEYKVGGILESIGDQGVDQIVYISLDDARAFFDKDEEVNAIFAAVEEGKDLKEVAAKIETNLEQARDDDDFVVFTPDDVLNQLGSILGVVQFILAGIAGIALVVGGIGIMNSMYTSVLERTRQIGVMKAVGASQSHILSIFVLEAGLIGLAGGFLGIILGNGFAFAVQGIAALAGFSLLRIEILWNVALFGLVFAFVVGVISGLYPAFRAARLHPIEALRYE
jgi:putative ABC transport system permease protein